MVQNIKNILKENSNEEVETFLLLSKERFLLYFQNKYNQEPSKERTEDFVALTGMIKLGMHSDIGFDWYVDYIFPSENVGSLGSLAVEYDGIWILLNDLGLLDPISKNKF